MFYTKLEKLTSQPPPQINYLSQPPPTHSSIKPLEFTTPPPTKAVRFNIPPPQVNPMPVLTNPPPETNLSLHQVQEILRASQQQEIRQLQNLLSALQHEQLHDLSMLSTLLRQSKIELFEHMILVGQTKLQSLQLIDNVLSTVEFALAHKS